MPPTRSYLDAEFFTLTILANPFFHLPLAMQNAEKGDYIGSPCEFTCSKRLHHVYCDPTTNECTCEKLYPVVIGISRGCAKRT